MIFDNSVISAGATILLLSFAIITPTISLAYEFVKCPDLKGNMVNYPEGTVCIGDRDENDKKENK